MAVEIGIASAAVLALRHVARSAQVTSDASDLLDPNRVGSLLDEGILTYRLDGALFFGAAQRFLTELTAVSDAKVVVLRLPALQVLDATGAQALGEIVAELEHRGITVLLKGPRPEHLRILAATGVLARQNHLFDDLDAALSHALLHVERARDATRSPPPSDQGRHLWTHVFDRRTWASTERVRVRAASCERGRGPGRGRPWSGCRVRRSGAQ